jgi:Uma2 family endonuclease
VLVEVPSDLTEQYDRGEKFEHYWTIPTLREYVLVSHPERHIEVRRREGDGRWTSVEARRGGTVELRALSVVVTVDEVYERSALTREL